MSRTTRLRRTILSALALGSVLLLAFHYASAEGPGSIEGSASIEGSGSMEGPPPPDFEVPEGFAVEEVYSSDDAGTVVAITFDSQGELVISREDSSIFRLRDADGDGAMDEEQLVTDQVTNSQGLLFDGADLLAVGDGPEEGDDDSGLYRVVDEDGDGQGDRVEVVARAFGGMQEHGPHNVFFGPDGYLYWTMGNHTNIRSSPDPLSPLNDYEEGVLALDHTDARGHASQIRAPGGKFYRKNILEAPDADWELVVGGFRNQYDGAFNLMGELFTFDSDMEWDRDLPWYRPVTTVHAVPGGDFGWRTGSRKLPHYYIDALPPLQEQGRGSPVGVEFYQSYSYPEEYRGAFLQGDWSRGRILVSTLTREGATYAETSSKDFVYGEPLNVTDLDIGPDGNMYFALGGRDTEGGIYRVVYNGPDAMTEPEAATPAEEVLTMPQPRSAFGRQQARSAKEQMGEASWKEGLAAVVEDAQAAPERRVRALELLQVYGPAPEEDMLVSLGDDSAWEVRAASTYYLGLHETDAARRELAGRLQDENSFVQRRAAEALVRTGVHPAMEVPFSAAEDVFPLLESEDRFVRYAARTLLRRMDRNAWREATLQADQYPQAAEALMAYVQTIDNPNVFDVEVLLQRQLELLEADPSNDELLQLIRVMERTMLEDQGVRSFTVEQEQAVASDSAAVQFAEVEQEGSTSTFAFEFDGGSYGQIAGDATAEGDSLEGALVVGGNRLSLTGTRKGSKQASQQQDSLQQQQGASPVRESQPQNKQARATGLRGSWSLELQTPQGSTEGTLAVSGSPDSLAGKIIFGQGSPDLVYERMGRVLLERFPAADSSLNREFARVFAYLQPPGAVAKLVAALDSARLSREQQIHYAYALSNIEAGWDSTSVDQMIAWFEKVDNERWRGGASFSGYISLLREDLLAHLPEEHRAAASERLEALEEEAIAAIPTGSPANSPHDLSDEELAEELIYDPQSFEGDPGAGAVAYQKALCATCHTFGPLGREFGPDLTTVGQRFARSDLVKAIMYPSQTISDQWANQQIQMTDGKTVAGFIYNENAQEVVVQLPGGGLQTIPKSNIASREEASQSSMPEALHHYLTQEELVDLLLFLEEGVEAIPDSMRSAMNSESTSSTDTLTSDTPSAEESESTSAESEGAATAEETAESLFNGEDLTGWDGDPRFWSVEDGMIVGQTTADQPAEENTFLIWKGDPVEDFRLTLDFRMEGGNSGVQYRSQASEDWGMSGYQADMDAENQYTGMLYEEKKRGILARRGQEVVVDSAGDINVTGSVGDPDSLGAQIDMAGWNQYEVIARGNHLIHKVNGNVTMELTDRQVEARADSGMVALQIHTGPPMKVEFKDIMLTRLPPASAEARQ